MNIPEGYEPAENAAAKDVAMGALEKALTAQNRDPYDRDRPIELIGLADSVVEALIQAGATIPASMAPPLTTVERGPAESSSIRDITPTIENARDALTYFGWSEERINRWLKERDRAIREQAWDECVYEVERSAYIDWVKGQRPWNPYKEQK